MAISQGQKNITRSFIGEGPVADLFTTTRQQANRPAANRVVSLVDPFAYVFRPYFGVTNANRGNAQVENGPLGTLIQKSV